MQENEVTTNKVVTEARKRFDLAQDAYSKNRSLAIDDTRFVMGDSDNMYQWPDDISNGRSADKKICLTVNLTAQHCNQIINETRRARPACRVMPADDYADKKTAEILAGLIRNIQVSSNADDAHDLAFEHSVYGGEGFWRVITEYETPSSFDQVIKIKQCPNPQLVFVDQNCKEIDKSDAEWGFIFEDISKETFKREHPEIDPTSWAIDKSGWIAEDTFRQAEYFYCEYKKDKALLLADGSTVIEGNLPEGVRREGMMLVRDETFETIGIIKERDTEIKKWKWCKLVGGHDTPIEEQDWLGDYLPIICITGKELNVNGEIIKKGIVRDLKDPARMANYAFSETVQTLALQNKIPYMAAAESVKGWENKWANANNSNDAYLPFNAYTDDGQQLPRPERQHPATMPAAQIQLLQVATEQMRGASGQQNANFGIKSEASSGVGIQRLKAQGEIATFHFPDNHARGLRYEAKILINLIQKYYDTKRIVRILGLDGKEQKAVLDPNMQQPYAEQHLGADDIQKIFNPTVGQYDVVIDTGPSYQTQRQESFAAMTEMASRNPALMNIAGDLIMRAADFPNAEELAKRFEKTLPPELRDDKQQGGAEQRLAQITQEHQQMAQQMDMLSQQLEEAQMRLQQAESGVDKSRMELEVKRQIAELDAAMQEKKMLQDAELKQRQMMLDAEMKREQMAMDMQLAREKVDAEAEIVFYKTQVATESAEKTAKISAGSDIAGKMMLAHQDICAKVKMNEDNNDTKKDIAELDAYVKLETAGLQNAQLATDVNLDLKEDIKEDKED